MVAEQLLERSAQRTPDKTALVSGSDRASYRQVEERANRLAQTLLDGGLRRGSRVVISLDNSIEAVVSIFGVLKAGGVFVIVNPRSSADRLANLLADSGATAMIARGDVVATLQRNGDRFGDVKTAIVAGDRRASRVADGMRALSLADVLGAGSAPPVAPSKRHVDVDLAALVYTSGSTGGPKGVMLTHRNLTVAAAAICTYLENTADDVILNALPLAFTYGLGQVTTAFHAGATVVLERSFAYPRAVLDTMGRERVTGMALVPTTATLLLQQDLKGQHFPYLRYLTNAAAALSTSKIERLRQAFPGVRIFSMYGQTECQRVSYLPPDQIETRPTSVGVPIPGTEAFVVDDRGHRVPPGTIGELVVRGPHVMRGYWRQPDLTAKALRAGTRPGEKVLYTGDLFQVDGDGYLYFIDRKDDIIKTGGEKVAPREVEDVIARLPGVAEVAVYGMADDLLGEAIAAVVTLTRGATITREEIQRHCLAHIDAIMVPKIIDIQETLPTTTSGKVNRRALQAAATAGTGGPAR